MSVHQIQVRESSDLPVLAGARLAAGAQLTIVAFYLAGAVAPALWAKRFPLHAGEADIQLWSSTAGAPVQLLHLLAFFAASVGLVITGACVPMCVAVLARHWRRCGGAARAVFVAAIVLGAAFLAFSLTPYGFALRDWLAQ
jgi:hypothetical protein